MTWDPEIDDPVRPPRPELPDETPDDYGADRSRDLGDEPPPAYRTEAPDLLAPIDPDAPVSGHQPPPVGGRPISESVEQSWEAAKGRVFPLLRPVGTAGMPLDDAEPDVLMATQSSKHTQPLVDEGPAGTVVVYAVHDAGFDIIVSGDHLLTWAVTPDTLRDAAIANLAAWSSGEGWTEEQDGTRSLLSSASGDGWDASRILLPDVRRHLADTLGRDGDRVLVGLPERHLLVASRLSPADGEFGRLFGEFVVETAGGADEPIDRRVFELVDGQLVEFAG
jgi:hypothetical protein